MADLPSVTVVVGTYNAQAFVAQAIESALAQDHPDCEVIVVDDASTDGTREVLERYARRVRLHLRATNGGQSVAYDEAWRLGRGSIVIFLDGDDLLERKAASTVARHWNDRLVKLQYQVVTIDEAGGVSRGPRPVYPPGLDAARMRALLLRQGYYPSVPACGNAYARSFLEARSGPPLVLPWWDLMLEVDAPFFGEVASLNEPLARKRDHGAASSGSDTIELVRFEKLFALFDMQLAYLAARCAAWNLPIDPQRIRKRSAWHQELLLILARLRGASRRDLFRRLCGAVAATATAEGPLLHKQKLLLWQTIVAFAPKGLALRALESRFRPKAAMTAPEVSAQSSLLLKQDGSTHLAP